MTLSCPPAPPVPADAAARAAQPGTSETARPPRSARYHSLDFWRGVACLLVIVYHSTFYAATSELLAAVKGGTASFADSLIAASTWLWVGVPIFFVISGYCISATADSTRRKGNPVRLYFWRRLRRIFPPYWIFLAISVAVVWAVERHVSPGLFCDSTHPFPDPASLSPTQWVGTITLTELWRHHLFGPEMRLFLQHAWTLCYEEQFYAVVGLILLISPRRFFTLAALVTAAVFTLEWFHAGRAPRLAFIHRNSTGFFFDGYWLFFAAGIGVYYFINYARFLGRIALVGAFLFGVAWGLRTNNETRAISFSYALLLLVLHRWDVPLAAARWSAPVTWCGTMCYSLYLVHLPVCKALSHALARAGIDSPLESLLITVPACIAASLLVAWPFHVWVERRFLNAPPAARPRGSDREVAVRH